MNETSEWNDLREEYMRHVKEYINCLQAITVDDLSNLSVVRKMTGIRHRIAETNINLNRFLERKSHEAFEQMLTGVPHK